MKPEVTRRLLPLEWKHCGHPMKQIKRTDTVAMYSKANGFEVIVIQKHDGYEIAGSKVEPAEHFPNNEAFGKLGWYYTGKKAREQAEAKYKQLNGW